MNPNRVTRRNHKWPSHTNTLKGPHMNKLFAALIAGLIASSSFAASHVGAPMAGAAPMEAMKPGDPKPEAAAQAKVDARKEASMTAMQPEAMTAGSEKAEARAEMKKHKKAKIGKKNSTDAQMKRDAEKL
jgi:hypothetical protein